jgi:hypothetical protein
MCNQLKFSLKFCPRSSPWKLKTLRIEKVGGDFKVCKVIGGGDEEETDK